MVRIHLEFPSAKEGERIYLCKESNRTQKIFDIIDSLSVGNTRKHTFELKNPQADKYQVRLSKNKLDLFIDGISDTYIILNDPFAKTYIKSNATDTLIRLYEKANQNFAFSQIYLGLSNKKYIDQGTTMPDSILKPILKMIDTLNLQKGNICKEALNRSDLSLAYIVLSGGASQYENIEINKAYDRMSLIIRQSDIGKEFKAFLDKLNNLSVGGKVPDFTEKTPDGKEVRLYDFIKGKKVILIDFWASWCGPCRKENPNVVKIFYENKEKGFDVISVSLDSKMENWTAAIETDGLTWTHVSDLGGWKEKTAKLYNVTAVPCTFLIDSTGIIIATNLRGEELKDKIESLCNSK
ncbi:MAG: hypothetical protein A2X18_01720 [Bacteroidetes bacterium GWF2_40_14]|nr:MAG: hypothetical protein A2X18_01720 [Bacteroidetes bacterium GWF2_40_14]